MKNKFWLFQIPLVILFTACFYVTEMGAQGSLSSRFLHDKVFPTLRVVSGAFTNIKFRIRGAQAPKNKIVVVEVDSPSLEEVGRWPWHRDVIAKLIDKAFDAGAKVVGLDIVFSERDQRIPSKMAEDLKARNMGNLVDHFETDPLLAATIRKHSDRLVLGWATDALCSPKYTDKEDCPVSDPEWIAHLPQGIEKFAFNQFNTVGVFDLQKTPLLSVPTVIANLPEFSGPASHSGAFNIEPDADNYVRRTPLIYMMGGKPHPALALEMARVGLGETIKLDMDSREKVATLTFAGSGKHINVNPMGVMEINFRGPGGTFPYVPAIDLLGDDDKIQDVVNRKLAGLSKSEILKDAYVLIGVTAVGVYDMRAFPFDSNVAGVEGHANILDNLLSGDSISSPTSGSGGFYIILFLMTVGAIAFGYLTEKLEAIKAILLFLGALVGFGMFDTQVLFKNGYNWDTGFFTIELSCIFFMTLAMKYMLEERNKKFIKSAFSKYVAPAIVDSILKDPSKLTLGGERRDLTVMFSDVRGFTTFSERMDAKALSQFLNDYLGIMTKIVFANDGTLDKYIGDAVMAFWGAPLDQPKHAYNAAKAAREMMQALAANKDRFMSQYGVEVDIGIGINTGVVSVGNMGSETNFEYTVIGDHVNLASRLEGLTKAYGVSMVTTRFTIDHIKELGLEMPPTRTLDHVKVKGKKNAVELIQLCEAPLKPEGLMLFEEGKKLYGQRQWDQAIATFKNANELLGGSDGPCRVYLERCEDFKKAPPEPDWDGSWEMHSK
jgi:adenylate cyclase